MLIELPETFYSENANIISEKLYINNLLAFEKTMYEITYKINGKYCHYCGKALKKKNSTIDHLYPRNLGGISITNNLKPACSKCNSQKGDKTELQYLKLLKTPKNDLRFYKLQLQVWKEQIYKNKGFFLPDFWVENIDTNSVNGIVNKNRPLGQNYIKNLHFFEKYNNFPKPIIVDNNFYLLDGWNILFLAKEKNIKKVPAIWCENVSYY